MLSSWDIFWLRCGHSRLFVRLTLLALFSLLFFWSSALSSAKPLYVSLSQPKSENRTIPDEIDLQSLRSLSSRNKFRYSRCDINLEFDETVSKRNRTQQLDQPLPDFIMVDFEQDPHKVGELVEHISSRCSLQVSLPPPPPQVDASHLMFGVATTLERLSNSLETFSRWAAHSKATILAIVEPDDETEIRHIHQHAAELGFNLTILQQEGPWDDRYFSLTKALYEQRQHTTQWGAIIDDDTFFLSISRLVDRLASFDPTQQHYLGGLTEDYYQTWGYGLMAYGGAGVFLSMPLLEKLYPFHEECSKYDVTGDRRIADCVIEHTLTRFVHIDGFHQLDMHGDLSGFYESGRDLPLSIHHWKSWHQAPIGEMALVGTVCGGDCLLRRFKFSNGWYLTNGFSVVRYSDERPEDDITMERTWWDSGEYQHSLAPLRPKDERKVSLRLVSAIQGANEGEVRQFYVHEEEQINWILEIVWKAPKRRGGLLNLMRLR